MLINLISLIFPSAFLKYLFNVFALSLGKGFDLDNDGIRDEVELKKADMNNLADSIEADKKRQHESMENEKDRANKKELERIKSKNKAKV